MRKIVFKNIRKRFEKFLMNINEEKWKQILMANYFFFKVANVNRKDVEYYEV